MPSLSVTYKTHNPRGETMDSAVFAHRVQFAFTVMFHYLFPILTMGLGFFIALRYCLPRSKLALSSD